jgi:heptosyltransferase-2
MRVAILKPDHLGDLILAAPAIAALKRRFDELTLLCHPDAVALARHLFPGLALRPILLPHLDRRYKRGMDFQPLREIRDDFDLFICLRWDAIIKTHLDAAGVTYQTSESDALDVHVAVEQRDVIATWTGPYDLLTSFDYAPWPRELPRRPKRVGLCVAAGYPLNAWPLNHWLELAERLTRRRIEIVWIGGPSEISRLRALAEAHSSPGKLARMLIGGADFGKFLDELAESVELVIATDSGTEHLASLVRPVLSIFGGSPWRRFAPLGPCNAIVTRQLPCSPCPQFDRSLVNTCATRECLTNLTPYQIEVCLDAYLAGRASVEPRRIGDAWLARAPWEYTRSFSRDAPAECSAGASRLNRKGGR